MLRFTPSDMEFIEDIVRQRVKFNRILKQQTAFFRNNPPEYAAALARLRGQSDYPRPEQVELFLNDCNKTCDRDPQNSDE